MRPTILPATITLPASAMVDAPHLRTALGVSRAVIHLWRRDGGFPLGHRDGSRIWTITDAVQKWCEGHGATVVRL